MRKHWALIGLRSQCRSLFMITWGCEEQLRLVHKQKDSTRKTSCSNDCLLFLSLFFARLILFIYSGAAEMSSAGVRLLSPSTFLSFYFSPSLSDQLDTVVTLLGTFTPVILWWPDGEQKPDWKSIVTTDELKRSQNVEELDLDHSHKSNSNHPGVAFWKMFSWITLVLL